jgi:cytoplasmic FMR1 interacting protein
LLDVLLQLDHLKNAKASIPNDFSWYKRYMVAPYLSEHL